MEFKYKFIENGWNVKFFEVTHPSNYAVYVEDDLIGYVSSYNIRNIKDSKNAYDIKVFEDIKNICGSIDFVNELMDNEYIANYGFNSSHYSSQYFITKLDSIEKKELVKILKDIESNEDYYYQDNFRYCIDGDEESEKKYLEAANTGCCGNFEIEYKVDENRSAIFGFNYGH